VDCLRLLISNGARVDSPSNNAINVRPLHSAVANQHLGIACILLESGVSVDATQADEYTPMHAAVQNGQTEMIHLPLEYSANSQAETSNGKTPIALALEQNHLKLQNCSNNPGIVAMNFPRTMGRVAWTLD